MRDARVEAVSRLQVAWRVLRHGPSLLRPAPEPTTTVSPEELRELIGSALAGAGLPSTWADQATLKELETASLAITVAADARRQEWAGVEAGRW